MENFQIRLKYHVFNELLSFVDWNNISHHKHKTLSEDFIRGFQDKVNWDLFQSVISENFIREFKDKVNFISEDFIREFKDKVDWDFL